MVPKARRNNEIESEGHRDKKLPKFEAFLSFFHNYDTLLALKL